MLLTEYNETETMELFKEEGRAEGEAQGRIAESVRIYREEMNLDNSTIISRIKDRFDLPQQVAEEYVLAEKADCDFSHH